MQDFKSNKIFHVSENGKIKTFKPRPSPSVFQNICKPVVFAISNRLLHNYLLPRDCPRVTYYATAESSTSDKTMFLNTSAKFVVAIESVWFPVIQQTTLYCYEFDRKPFTLLDECAGYYVSFEPVKPIKLTRIDNPLDALLKRNNVELRVLPTLWKLAGAVSKSSLNFSLIRMKNTKPIGK